MAMTQARTMTEAFTFRNPMPIREKKLMWAPEEVAWIQIGKYFRK